MAVTDRHVNGPALISIDVNGGTSYANLGYSKDGVDITPTFFREEVYTDVLGPNMPHDVQDMGSMAIVSFELTTWDASVWTNVSGGVKGRTAGQVDPRDIGALYMQNSRFHSMVVSSNARTGAIVDEPSHYFPTAILWDSTPTKLGTRVHSWNVTYHCFYTLAAGYLYGRQ